MRSDISIKFVYPFKELGKEAKEYAIAKHYEYEDFPFLEDDLNESLSEFKYWEDTKLQYSLSCCQGDGLSFSGTLNLEKWISEKMPDLKHKETLKEYIYNIFSKGNTGHYSFASKNDIDWECNYSHGKTHKRLDKEAERIVSAVREDYMTICRKLEKEGYAILEYRMTHEEFEDYAEVNGYEYTENGKLA